MTNGTELSPDYIAQMVGRIVEVRWLDIVQRAMHPDHKLRPAECATCGRLMDVDRTDGTLTIVMEVMDGEVTKQVFPLGCVTGVSDA